MVGMEVSVLSNMIVDQLVPPYQLGRIELRRLSRSVRGDDTQNLKLRDRMLFLTFPVGGYLDLIRKVDGQVRRVGISNMHVDNMGGHLITVGSQHRVGHLEAERSTA